jgi:sugar O-acyltransferase (sialic acid O-acetyltransferase NeuD family)
MNKKLLIIGAGGHGRVVADAAVDMHKWDVISFVDSRYPNFRRSGEWSIVGMDSDLSHLKSQYDSAIIAIGDNQIRLNLLYSLKKIGFHVATVVHPSAQVGGQVSIGEGTVILSNAVVNHGASLGDVCIVNTAATVDHDSKIGNSVHLSPGVHLGGGVLIGATSWVGIGASVTHNCIIGSGAIVGAGSVVIDNVPDDMTVVGSPAKPI